MNMINKTFGNITIISFSHSNKFRRKCWVGKCACGNIKVVDGAHLRSGAIVSCGCLKKTYALIHGESAFRTKENVAWHNMKSRCYDSKNRDYHNYGGRGIILCEEWKNYYAAFLNDMGRAPSPSFSIDRINTNGNYEKSNCKWSTALEQANNKRNNKKNTQYVNLRN